MGISFVSGSMLNEDLTRTTDLAFNGNLIYLDVNANRVGINTATPGDAFEVVGNILVGNITIPSVGNVLLGNVNINNLAEPIANSDAATKFYVDAMSGNVTSIGNLTVADTTITTVTANANILIDPNGTGEFQIVGTNGFVIPVGTTAERPSPTLQGTMRFNSDNLRVEVYDGTEWDQIVGGVTNQAFDGDGSTVDFTLDRVSTSAAALVMLNGVVQVPGVAYNMTPNPSANLVFTEAPAVSDKIDIRFL